MYVCGAEQQLLYQHPFEQARRAVHYMFEYLAEGKRIANREELLDPIVIMKSNMDLYQNFPDQMKICCQK